MSGRKPFGLFCIRNLKPADRKSTRLNSSHTVISYAVFCLKKKKRVDNVQHTTAATDDDIKMFVQTKMPITTTILDHRQEETDELNKGAPYRQWKMLDTTWT